jgi:hypothetical protein
MNKAKRLSCIITSVLILLILVTGCGRPLEDKENEQSLVLQSYTVPAEYASEVSSIINSLLTKMEGGQQVKIGQARVGPGNIVLVTAPASIQSGIEKMISDLKQSKPEPPPMVSLTYWIVRGRPAKETTWPSNLKEIESALKAVASSDEPMSFSLQERLNLQSLSGEDASIYGRTTSVTQRVTIREGSVLGDIVIGRNSFQSRVQIELDKVLVLGQSGLNSSQLPTANRRGSSDDPEASLLYIVRADSKSEVAQ